jgi:hypothetical protein
MPCPAASDRGSVAPEGKAMLDRVISGGQTGADQAGWRAAKQCGISTGSLLGTEKIVR